MACLFIVASVALAALPRPGVFTGESSANAKVRFEVQSRHNISLIKVTEPKSCDFGVTKFHDVHVQDNGTFKAAKRAHGYKVFSIKGEFVRRRKAKGEISQVTCSGEDSTYTVRRQS